MQFNLKYKRHFLKDIWEFVNALCLWGWGECNVEGRYNCKLLNKFMYYFKPKKIIKMFINEKKLK